jgi:hypothetical protein
LTWEQSEVDLELLKRNSLSKLENAELFALYGRPIRGMKLEELYPNRRDWTPGESSQLRHERRMARMQRLIDQAEEGSATWVRLEEMRIRRQREWEQANR